MLVLANLGRSSWGFCELVWACLWQKEHSQRLFDWHCLFSKILYLLGDFFPLYPSHWVTSIVWMNFIVLETSKLTHFLIKSLEEAYKILLFNFFKIENTFSSYTIFLPQFSFPQSLPELSHFPAYQNPHHFFLLITRIQTRI